MAGQLTGPEHLPFTELPPELRQDIPDDKTWLTDQWLLDIKDGVNDTVEYVETSDRSFGTDVQLLPGVTASLKNGEPVYVGDSGKIRRSVTYLFRIFGLEPRVIFDKTMIGRPFRDDPDVHKRSVAELLDPAFDNHSSQYPSIAVLLGKPHEPSPDMPPKLRVAYQVRADYLAAQREGRPVQRPLDANWEAQGLTFLNWLITGNMEYVPTKRDGETFCFRVMFGITSLEEAAKEMPAVASHESNRILAVQQAKEEVRNHEKVTSNDHRVILTTAMRFGLGPEDFTHPEAINKSFPLGFQFISKARALAAASSA